MSYEPHNVLITGGAGFIGANFVRHWLGRRGEGRVVVLDALTYAGNPENLQGLEQRPALRVRARGYLRRGAVRELMERYQIDTLVHFAAESHVDRSILGPDDFIRTNVVGTHALLKAAKNALARSANGVRASIPSRVDGRGLRIVVPDRSAVSRIDPVRPEFSLLREQGRLGSPGARLSRDLRSADHRHQLLEQLRTLSVSREVDSAHAHQHPQWQAAAGLRRWAAGARLAACGGSLRGDHARARQRPSRGRYTTSAATARPPTSRSCAPCAALWTTVSAKTPRCARLSRLAGLQGRPCPRSHYARPRPAWPRSPLRDRLHRKRAAISAIRRPAISSAACERPSSGTWAIAVGGRR